MKGSRAYLDRRIAKGGRRLAIVLDIDNTSIATHYDWPKPVEPVRRFAAKAHRLGIAVFVVTGRHRAQLRPGQRALERAGYHVRSYCTHRKGETVQRSKLRCRKGIERRGYRIIANVGNRSTDFWHGHYERGFKLPSYGRRLS